MASRQLADHAADRRLLVQGAAWSALAWAVALVTGPVLTVVFARSMTHEQFGLLAVASAVIGPATALATLGLGPAVTQIASARSGSHGDAGVLHTLRVARGLALRALPWICVASAALVLAVRGIHSIADATVVVAVMLPTVLLAPFSNTFDGVLRATGQPRWAGGASAIGSTTGAVAAVVLVLAGARHALPIAAARSIGPIVVAGVLALGVKRWADRRPADTDDGDVLKARRLLSFSGAMLLTSFGWLLVSQLDIFILGAWNGPVAAGLYTPASRIADLGITVAAIGGSFLLPAITRALALDEPDKANHLFHWASRWAFVGAAPIAAVLLVTPGSVLQMLFGDAFAASATAGRVLGVGLVVQIIGGFNGLALEARGVPRISAIRATAGIVVSVALCLALVPTYGATGAAWATSAAIAVINTGSSLALFRRFHVQPWDAPFLATIGSFGVAVALGWVAVRELDGDFVRCLVAGVIGLGVTAAAAWLARDRDDESRSVGPGAANHGEERAREDQQVQ